MQHLIFKYRKEIGKKYLDLYNSTSEIQDSTNLQVFSLLSFMEDSGFYPVLSYLKDDEIHGLQGNLGFVSYNCNYWGKTRCTFVSFQQAVKGHNSFAHHSKIVKKIYLQIHKKQKSSKVVANKFLVEFGYDVKEGKSQ